jgi:omega-hydroxy-beta-dihydromenaquinone-9 sulfotransferase
MTAPLSKPIFVVGLPRTGSKLLMNIINNNNEADYHLANEVQFFGHSFLGRLLQGRRGIMPIVDSERNEGDQVCWERVVDRLYSGEAKGVHWNGLKAGWLSIPKSRLLENLKKTDGSVQSVYSAILATQEKEHAGYGDKSGPNLYFVDTLLQWFPDGKVLHIIRDPRAILTSQHRRLTLMLEGRGGSSPFVTGIKKLCYSPIIVLYILIYWGRAIRIDNRFAKSHPQNYMRVQFEELIAQPEETTRRICQFLSIPWDRKMLEPPKRDSSYVDPSDIQKNLERGRGMDIEAAERWRKHIRPWMSFALRLYGGFFYREALERFGYVDA